MLVLAPMRPELEVRRRMMVMVAPPWPRVCRWRRSIVVVGNRHGTGARTC